MKENFETINAEFLRLGIKNVMDYGRIFSYMSSFHSTAIEGSTLSQIETQLFLENKLPIHGKPMYDHDMVRDYFNAFQFISESSKSKTPISVDFIKNINQQVMKNTGSIVNTILGNVATSKGNIRNFAVRVGSGGYYMNHEKVQTALNSLLQELNQQIPLADTITKKHHLAFDMHFNFVTIHPFGDGNGRTSRLLMNYIQLLFNLPLSIVFVEDKNEYIDSLIKTREVSDIKVFRDFMEIQHIKLLTKEIQLFKSVANSNTVEIKKNNGFGLSMFL